MNTLADLLEAMRWHLVEETPPRSPDWLTATSFWRYRLLQLMEDQPMTENQGRGEQRSGDPAGRQQMNVREMTEHLRGALRTAKHSGITGEQTRGLVDEIFGKDTGQSRENLGSNR